jgi:hypothetical protein
MGVRVGSMLVKKRCLGGRGGNDATSDPVAGVARRIGLHVVGLFVDDDRRASVGDDAVGGGGVKGQVIELEAGLADMAFTDGHILGQVACVMAHGVEGAMLLAFRVEVACGGLEVRSIAQRFSVDMYRMFADGKIFEVEFDRELALLLPECGGSGVLSGAGLDGNDDCILRWLSYCRNGEEANCKCSEGVAHEYISDQSLLVRIQKYFFGLRELRGKYVKFGS